jgi:hypothetical protein
MDPRLMQARELHRQAADSERLAGQFRAQRDELIRLLHREDGMTYPQLAAAIGCSYDLIKSICLGRVGPGTRGRRRAG